MKAYQDQKTRMVAVAACSRSGGDPDISNSEERIEQTARAQRLQSVYCVRMHIEYPEQRKHSFPVIGTSTILESPNCLLASLTGSVSQSRSASLSRPEWLHERSCTVAQSSFRYQINIFYNLMVAMKSSQSMVSVPQNKVAR
jgi:hypothetical protein